MDRVSILQKYVRLILSENGHGTLGQEMDAELAMLQPRKERKPDPISLDMGAGRWVGITDETKERWASAFPAVDVRVELGLAAEWVLAHPERKKVRYSPFLVRWLTRAQQRGPSRGQRIFGDPIAESRVDKWARKGNGD